MNSAPRPNRSAVESAPLAPDAPDEGRWRARFVFAGKSLVNVSFVAVLVVGALRLTDKAREAPRHQVDLDRWAVLQRPAWSRLSDVEAVRAHSDLPGRTVSVLDRKALGAIRDRLEASPIVLRVHEVRRRLPGRVEVVAELRVPVAAVEVPRDGAADLRSFVEVDRDATSLGPPSAERPWRRGRPLRLVRGVHGPVPAAGGRWGPDARAGAELCAHLDQVLPELRGLGDGFLDVVDVSNLAGRLERGRSEVSLGSTSGDECTVIWGRLGPRAEELGEPDFEAKFGRLREALRLFPGLEGLARVHVAFEELTIVPERPDAPAEAGSPVGVRHR